MKSTLNRHARGDSVRFLLGWQAVTSKTVGVLLCAVAQITSFLLGLVEFVFLGWQW